MLTTALKVRGSRRRDRCFRLIIGAAAFVALPGLLPAPVHAAPTLPPAAHHPARFDWRLYESWTRAHGRPGIPLTRFSWPWMAHRALCGGAVSGEILNPRTLSTIQDFDRCWADWYPLSTAPLFRPYTGPGLVDQNGAAREQR